jgi:hypothetical protein
MKRLTLIVAVAAVMFLGCAGVAHAQGYVSHGSTFYAETYSAPHVVPFFQVWPTPVTVSMGQSWYASRTWYPPVYYGCGPVFYGGGHPWAHGPRRGPRW